jgi:hypothetical protein
MKLSMAFQEAFSFVATFEMANTFLGRIYIFGETRCN